MKLQLFSERCSGSNYFAACVRENYPDVRFVSTYGRKHWLTDQLLGTDSLQDTLIYVVLIRSPYAWLKSLFRRPWHCDATLRNVAFSDFIRHEWHCVWDSDANISPSDPRWGKEMLFERNPETGRRYRNVLEMRTTKYRIWEERLRGCDKFLMLRHEQVLSEPHVVLSELGNKAGVSSPANCTIPKGYKGKLSLRRKVLCFLSGGRLGTYKQKPQPPLKGLDISFIKDELDPVQEARWGYDLEALAARERELGVF